MAFDGTLTPTKLGRGAIDTSPAVTTFYTVPTLTRALVTDIDICNTTAGALTVTVYLVESGGTPGAANTLIPGVTVSPNGMFTWNGLQILNAGDTIQATASGAGCTANISGAEAV